MINASILRWVSWESYVLNTSYQPLAATYPWWNLGRCILSSPQYILSVIIYPPFVDFVYPLNSISRSPNPEPTPAYATNVAVDAFYTNTHTHRHADPGEVFFTSPRKLLAARAAAPIWIQASSRMSHLGSVRIGTAHEMQRGSQVLTTATPVLQVAPLERRLDDIAAYKHRKGWSGTPGQCNVALHKA